MFEARRRDIGTLQMYSSTQNNALKKPAYRVFLLVSKGGFSKFSCHFSSMSSFLKEYQSKIESNLLTLEAEILSLKEQVKPIPPDNAIGRLSRMEAINAKSIDEANLRNSEAKLYKLQEILKKLKENQEVGICSECEEEIPKARLLTRPESTVCVECLEG